MRSFAGRDILSLDGFERAEFEHVFSVADRFEPVPRERRRLDLLKDKILVSAFFQASTRTRLAHESAMLRLGGAVTGFADPKMTRAGDFYQESIKDTVRMLEYYGDVIVMRHPQEGAPHEAARWASIPIINGGDGWGEHPTQVLTDLYTITRELGSVDGKTFVAVGDWRMRTMHSLAYALTQFDTKLIYITPDEYVPDGRLVEEVQRRGLAIERAEHVKQVIDRADIVFVEPVVQPDYTKGRDERSDEVAATPANYVVDTDLLAHAKSSSIVIHSLPRMDELPPTVDETRHARYWQEAYYGVVMRMALLALVMGATE
ncbi:MAG: aspartate carbamoyltransferase [Acidimicrobiia bacterium]|nr:aspartate carbamoyltransferase [Acidimicrobiia bacterium]